MTLRGRDAERRGLGPRGAEAGQPRTSFGLDAGRLRGGRFRVGQTRGEIRDALWATCRRRRYAEKEQVVEPDLLRRVERDIMLQIVDAQWKDHLYSLDHLKEGIGLRGYGQRDPLVEYKKESFELFQAMKERIDEETVRYLWRLRPMVSEGAEDGAVRRPPHGSPRRPPASCSTIRPRRSWAPPAGPREPGRRRRERPPPRAGRRRRRGGQDRPPGRAEGRPQRSVPVRQREEVQEVPRRLTDRTDRRILDQADRCRPFMFVAAARPTARIGHRGRGMSIDDRWTPWPTPASSCGWR